MDITDIIAKKLLGKATDNEISKLNAWLDSKASHRLRYERLLNDGSLHSRMDIMNRIEKDKGWKQLKRRIDKSSGNTRYTSDLSIIARVAAVVLIVVAVGWAVFPKDDRPVHPQMSEEVANAIHKSELTGKTAATVMVRHKASGGWTTTRNVKLSSNAALASLLDNTVDTDAECELQTLKTSEYWLTLEDGTRVHLDYNSRILFPTHFSGDKRQVYLDGTAYFFVSKDKERPFYVNTANGVVKEYGTEFLVNTRYANQTNNRHSPMSTEVVLVNGSISIITKDDKEYMMQPRDRMLVKGSHIQKEQNVDTSPYTAWNEGKFKFDNCRIDKLMPVISKWYGYNVVYNDSKSRDASLTGTFDRYGSLSDILRSISAVTGVNFEMCNDTIIVSYGNQFE